MDFTSAVSSRPARQRLLTGLALFVAALGTAKFLSILIADGAAKAPWGFLLVMVLPFLGGPFVMRWHPRLGVALTGAGAAVLAIVCVTVVIAGAVEPYLMDYVVVFVGGPVAAAVAVLAVTLVRKGGADLESAPLGP